MDGKNLVAAIRHPRCARSYGTKTHPLIVALGELEQSLHKLVAMARLYEQEPGEAFASARLGLYVRRWVTWACAGLGADR